VANTPVYQQPSRGVYVTPQQVYQEPAHNVPQVVQPQYQISSSNSRNHFAPSIDKDLPSAFQIAREWASNEILEVNGRPYVKLECIGKGGSSKVFKVLSRELKLFALKRVYLEGAEPSTIKSYTNEINLLQRLVGQRTIVRLIDSEINIPKGVIYLVEEIGEIDLAHLLRAQGKFIFSQLEINS
jgi:serine/threonine protein kinase